MNTAKKTLLIAACCALPFAARAGVEVGIEFGAPEVVVRSQPPPDRVEYAPISPGPNYIWIRGHWAWHHEHWEWITGRWDLVARPGLEWVPGRLVERNGGWVWIEGHYITLAAPQPRPPGAAIEVVASEEPPMPIVETVPAAPGPEFFWIGGHWHWNHGWVWVGGHYERHPHFHPGAGWEPGHWDRRGGAWVWRDGHWR